MALVTFALTVAAILRFGGLNWDDGTYPHPDERFMTLVAGSVHTGVLTPTDRDEPARTAHRDVCLSRNPATNGVGGWFDTACSDFNPANVGHAGYAYGQLPLTFVRLAAEAVAAATGWASATHYGGVHLVGRAASASADLLTLLACFLLGRLVWGRLVGVLAALFYAIAVLPIQSSHFWTVDAAATLAATMCLLFLVRIVRFGQRPDVFALGAAYGLALATKLSLLPLILLLPLAILWAPQRVILVERPSWHTRISLVLPDLVLAALASFFTFRIASPYAFVGPEWFDFAPNPAFFEQIAELRRIVLGISDIPPSWQWLGRTPWLSPGRDLALWGLGLPLALAAMVAMTSVGWRLMRGTPVQRPRAILWLWTVGYFIWMGQQWQSTMRYFLPIYPTLCLFAAAWLVTWWRRQRKAKARNKTPVLAAALIAVTTLGWAFAFHSVHTTLHPYVAATHWFLRNVPAGVSAPLVTGRGTSVMMNWPASGAFGDGITPRTVKTQSPANGSIDRVRIHHLVWRRGEAGMARVQARVLDGQGFEVASTGLHVLPPPATSAASPAMSALDLPLRAPLAIVAGKDYLLRLEVMGGVADVAGAAIAYEGAWNDPLPMRVPWLPPADVLDLRGPSGTAAPNAAWVDPFGEGHYRMLDLDMTAEDDAVKRTRLLKLLDEAEWLVIPNNRFYDSITLDPLRFPLSRCFYDALFDGSLGYERYLSIVSTPRLASLTIPDQVLPQPGQRVTDPARHTTWGSEEAFSVYDHPAVLIFRKTAAYSTAATAKVLDGINLIDIDTALQSDTKPQGAGRIKWSTLQASLAPDGILLAPGPRIAPPAPAENAGTPAALIIWYGVALVLGWLAWPGLAALWPGLPDRGYGTARIAGVLVVAGAAWWLTWLGLPTWSASGLLVLVALLTVATFFLARRHLSFYREWLRSQRRYVLVIEGLFLALFILGIGLRLVHPDLWAPALGGEKPMDYAILNSVLATVNFPPPDPWFSSGRLNYYYFGWVLVGVLVKLTGVTPALGYNLALATWYAMTGVGAFSLAWNACTSQTRSLASGAANTDASMPWVAGGVALIAAVILGNLDLPRAIAPNLNAVREVLSSPAPFNAGAVSEALTRNSQRWYWAPSRTVGERPGANWEVNEFPSFSFLHGDLHPHLMAFPLQLLALTVLLGILWPTPSPPEPPERRGSLALRVIALATVVAFLRATNSWDWPLYLALASLAVVVAAARLEYAPAGERCRGYERYGRIGLLLILLLSVQALTALPFSAYFVTGGLSLRAFNGSMTPLTAWLAVHGWFLGVLVPWLWILSREPLPEAWGANPVTQVRFRRLRTLRWLCVGYTMAALGWTLVRSASGVPAIGLQLALLAWLAELLWRNIHRRSASVGLAAAAAGVALSIAVELVVVGQDLGRMNTFFKFHLQAWIFLSVACGIALASMVRDTRIGGVVRRSYLVGLGGITALALAYLPLASYGRAHSRFEPHPMLTLDGEAFFATAVYHFRGQSLTLADDYLIVRWLREHAGPTDIVLEAQLPEYQWGSRISAFTGRPTVLGYRYHESQQRPVPELGKAIELRRENIAALYESLDSTRCLQVLEHYDVRYIVVGGLERAAYARAGLEKFAALAQAGRLREVFSAGQDRVYEVAATSGATRGPAW